MSDVSLLRVRPVAPRLPLATKLPSSERPGAEWMSAADRPAIEPHRRTSVPPPATDQVRARSGAFSREGMNRMAKRNGNREMKKPKQNKPKGAGASSVAELARTSASIIGKRR
jgi:hypothetical protein